MGNSNKRYYWLKLKENFFNQKEIKKLRKIAGGDTYTIIYLKMLLKSLRSNGFLYFEGIENNFVAELALDIDEEEENVLVTVQYLQSQGILEVVSEEEYLLTTCKEMTGSEAYSTERSRRCRNNKMLQCNTNETPMQQNETACNQEKEIEKEIDIEKEEIHSPKKENVCQQIVDMFNTICESFPKVTKLSETRKKTIKARLNIYSLDDFNKLFTKAEESNFLKGQNNRDWKANFDWLIKDANMAKVLDGNYDNKKQESNPKPKNQFTSYEQQRTYTKEHWEELEKKLLGK